MAQEVVPALLAADAAAGNVHLGPGTRLCVWDSAAANNTIKNGVEKGVPPPPPHWAPLVARYEVSAEFGDDEWAMFHAAKLTMPLRVLQKQLQEAFWGPLPLVEQLV